jgi:hypothetical protein
MEGFFTGPPGQMFKKRWLYFELLICVKSLAKNTGPPCDNMLAEAHLSGGGGELSVVHLDPQGSD